MAGNGYIIHFTEQRHKRPRRRKDGPEGKSYSISPGSRKSRTRQLGETLPARELSKCPETRLVIHRHGIGREEWKGAGQTISQGTNFVWFSFTVTRLVTVMSNNRNELNFPKWLYFIHLSSLVIYEITKWRDIQPSSLFFSFQTLLLGTFCQELVTFISHHGAPRRDPLWYKYQ